MPAAEFDLTRADADPDIQVAGREQRPRPGAGNNILYFEPWVGGTPSSPSDVAVPPKAIPPDSVCDVRRLRDPQMCAFSPSGCRVKAERPPEREKKDTRRSPERGKKKRREKTPGEREKKTREDPQRDAVCSLYLLFGFLLHLYQPTISWIAKDGHRWKFLQGGRR